MKWLCHLCEPLPCVFDNNIANGEWESKPEYCTITGKKCQWRREHSPSKEDLKRIKEDLKNRLLGKNMYIKETDKYYEKLEDAFKEYLKEHNCETCGKRCAVWIHIDRDIVPSTGCKRWQPKPCDHNYVSLDHIGATHVLFKCTKCDSTITYKKV